MSHLGSCALMFLDNDSAHPSDCHLECLSQTARPVVIQFLTDAIVDLHSSQLLTAVLYSLTRPIARCFESAVSLTVTVEVYHFLLSCTYVSVIFKASPTFCVTLHAKQPLDLAQPQTPEISQTSINPYVRYIPMVKHGRA